MDSSIEPDVTIQAQQLDLQCAQIRINRDFLVVRCPSKLKAQPAEPGLEEAIPQFGRPGGFRIHRLESRLTQRQLLKVVIRELEYQSPSTRHIQDSMGSASRDDHDARRANANPPAIRNDLPIATRKAADLVEVDVHMISNRLVGRSRTIFQILEMNEAVCVLEWRCVHAPYLSIRARTYSEARTS